MFKRLIAAFVCLTFIFNNLGYVHAQPASPSGRDFSVDQLPMPGTLVGESAPFVPLALKGLVVDPQKPLEFQFIVDTGRGPQDALSVKDQANQLVKYFLAGLTIPEGDLWVNLSPYEKNRMVPEVLGQTDLGRDLLAQDYILKQLTASLIDPEKELGKEFWGRVYAKAQERFGTTNVPVNTFNKVWILPDQAQVFENGNAAYVTKATLKVMLDEDYLAKQKHQATKAAGISSQIVRAIILPEIGKEVNTGKNFAPLRQIYQALILAKWYKQTIQNGLLDAIYTDKNKVAGINLNDPTVKEQIYNRYLRAYKKGAFNYIKEDPTPDGQVVPRKYFSGGFTEMGMKLKRDGAMSAIQRFGALLLLTLSLAPAPVSASTISLGEDKNNVMPAVPEGEGPNQYQPDHVLGQEDSTDVTGLGLPLDDRAFKYSNWPQPFVDNIYDYFKRKETMLRDLNDFEASYWILIPIVFGLFIVFGILAATALKNNNGIKPIPQVIPSRALTPVQAILNDLQGKKDIVPDGVKINDIVILGNDDWNVFRHALQLWQKHWNSRLVILGGKGRLTGPLLEQADDAKIPISNTSSEAVIIKQIIEHMIEHEPQFNDIKTSGLKPAFELEEDSTNTFENIEKYRAKIKDELGRRNKSDPYHIIYLQTPHQQLRTKATVEKYFKGEMDNGTFVAYSDTAVYGRPQENHVMDALGEALRLIIYSDYGNGTIANENKNLSDEFWKNVIGLYTSFSIDRRIRNAKYFKDLIQGTMKDRQALSIEDLINEIPDEKNKQRIFLKLIQRDSKRIQKDSAMLPSKVFSKINPVENGGIDFNTINVLRNGKTINVQFDPAQLNQLTQEGFEGFTPVITAMTPISSPFQLLGIKQT